MPGLINIKRVIKRANNWMAVTSQFLYGNESPPPASVFYYHRVARLDFIDARIDDHNVEPKVFERQIAALSELAEIVPLTALPQKLRRRASTAKPLVSLTFDDGYGHFYSNVLPILQRYDAPATLSVVTQPINFSAPMPFDKWAIKNFGKVPRETWQPLKWHEIEMCLASGLITLGAHSHQHLKGSECTRQQIYEEVGRSAEILYARFGKSKVPVYAYPYGNTHLGHVPEDYENAVRDAGFNLAVTTDFGHVSDEFNPYRLPRIEAHGVDFPLALQAKLESKFSPFYLHDYCRAAKHRLTNGGNKRLQLSGGAKS